jgi:glycosyltransferase involved in cell wall biosynthesis
LALVKTLLLSYSFPPQRFPRAIQVAHLARHSSLPLEVVAVDDEEPGDPGLAATLPPSLPVRRIPWAGRAVLERSLRDRTLKDRAYMPDPFAPWARAIARELTSERALGIDDVLVTFGQPMSDHLAGLRIARSSRARWIAHFSDPWVDSPFRRTSKLVARVSARQEAAVIKAADGLVFPSRETLDLVMRKYAPAARGKATVLPHAFDAGLYPATPDEAGEKLIVRYVGNFYGDRGPEPLFRGLGKLDAETLNSIRVELIGTFENDPLSVPGAAALPAGLVTVRPALMYLEALAAMKSADLLLIIDAPGPQSVFLPSKLVEYLGARRPIVGITPQGAAASLISAAGGPCAIPADPDATAEALRAGIALARANRGTEWGDPTMIDAYRAENVAAAFDEIVRSVARP